jgi:hypothetical protein
VLAIQYDSKEEKPYFPRLNQAGVFRLPVLSNGRLKAMYLPLRDMAGKWYGVRG